MWFRTECWAWQIIFVPGPYLLWDEFHLETQSRFSGVPVPGVGSYKVSWGCSTFLSDQSDTIFLTFLVLEGSTETCMHKPTPQVISFSVEELDWQHCVVEEEHKDPARWTQDSLFLWLEKRVDLHAESFQNTWSKGTMEGKSFLNVFLLWVPLWEVCLWLSLLQKLASESLTNEDISHVRKDY